LKGFEKVADIKIEKKVTSKPVPLSKKKITVTGDKFNLYKTRIA